jgi:hypothetical protein
MAERGDIPGAKTTPLGQGVIARAAGLIRNVMDQWFGPNVPLDPVAPPNTPVRTFDYPTSANSNTTPRSGEAITYDALRSLAENHDLTRLLIETRKDQIARRPIQFRLKEKAGEKKSDHKKREAEDARIAMLDKFFRSPDRENCWSDWIRMVMEDVLVIDAASLLPRFTVGGDLYGFDVVDGATIRRVLSYEGKTPLPPEAAYQQIIKGVPAVNITAPSKDQTKPQLIYRPRNKRAHKAYGYSPVEQVIMTMNLALRRQIHQLEYYTTGNIPDAIIGMPEGWSLEELERYESKWNGIFSGKTSERRKAKFVPTGEKGLQLQFTKEMTLKDDMDEYIVRVLAFAFNVAPNALVKQVNRASGDTMQESSLEEGLEPLLDWIEDLINFLVEFYFGFDDIEFAFRSDMEVDPKTQTEIHDIQIKNGTLSVDEAREELGRDPVGMTNAVYTATGPIMIEDAIYVSSQMGQEQDTTQAQQQSGTEGEGAGAAASGSRSAAGATKNSKKKVSARAREL